MIFEYQSIIRSKYLIYFFKISLTLIYFLISFSSEASQSCRTKVFEIDSDFLSANFSRCEILSENLIRLYEKYDHPLYKKLNEKTVKSGHGGMDGIMMYRIVECLNKGLPLDQNVYEGCIWSAVAPLSKQSILRDGKPQEFPDFTRGKWKETEKLGIVS